MENRFLNTVRAALFSAVVALAAFLPSHADAQTAAKQPQFIASNTWVDLANGPIEVLLVEGSAVAYTSGGNGTGTSAGTTALTLSATPAVAPCVGCIVTCAPTNTAACTIPANTTVTAYNGTTGVTTSASTTVTAASLVWGAACPAAGSGIPPAPSATGNSLSAPLNIRAAAGPLGGTAMPMYSTARVCLYGAQQQGGTAITFPIGAW